MKVGFTGTQKGMTDGQKLTFKALIRNLHPIKEFHHGDCIGSDEESHSFFSPSPITTIHSHPPINESKRSFCKRDFKFVEHPPKEYLPRNRDIVDACLVLIATPKGPEHLNKRSGTWYTIRYAKKTGKRVYFIMPDGKLFKYPSYLSFSS